MPINPQALLDLYEMQRRRSMGAGGIANQAGQQGQQMALQSLQYFQQMKQRQDRLDQQKKYQNETLSLQEAQGELAKNRDARANIEFQTSQVKEAAPGYAESALNARTVAPIAMSPEQAKLAANVATPGLGGIAAMAPMVTQVAAKDESWALGEMAKAGQDVPEPVRKGILNKYMLTLEEMRAERARQAALDAENRDYRNKSLSIQEQEARNRAADSALNRKLKQAQLTALENPLPPGQLDPKGRSDVIRVVKDSAAKRIQSITSAQTAGQITPEEASAQIGGVVAEMKSQMATIAAKNQDPFYAEAEQAAKDLAAEKEAENIGLITASVGRNVSAADVPGLAAVAKGQYQALPGIVKMRVDDVLNMARQKGMSEDQAFAFALKTIQEAGRGSPETARSEYLLPSGKVMGPTIPRFNIRGQ